MAGSMVSFPSNGKQCDGYLSTPASGKGPGVVVIQEYWGLNDNIKQIADRLAGEGYVAVAPDLFHGQVTAEPDQAMKLLMSMKMDEAARDMSGAYDYLKGHAACTGKVGSVGFCMGGRLSLYISTLKPVDATVVYYGVMMGEEPDFSKLQGPVLGHYAANDAFVPVDAVKALEQKLKGLGKDVEFHIYPNMQHGFFNDSQMARDGGVHDAAASKTTWERTLAFYGKHLR